MRESNSNSKYISRINKNTSDLSSRDHKKKFIPNYNLKRERKAEKFVPDYKVKRERRSKSFIPDYNLKRERRGKGFIPDYNLKRKRKAVKFIPDYNLKRRRNVKKFIPDYTLGLKKKSSQFNPNYNLSSYKNEKGENINRNLNDFTRKQNKIKKVIIEQLQGYSKKGNRIYTSTEATIKAGYSAGSRKSFSEQVHSLLIPIISPIKKSASKARVVYDMIFGQVITSYQNIKRRCEKARIELLTTPTQWFIMVKNNKGQESVSKLKIKIKYRDCGHITDKQITRIGQKRRGCYECNLKNLNRTLKYEDILGLAELRNLELLSNRNEFRDAIIKSKRKTCNASQKLGRSDHAILKWKCLECCREFKNTYNNIRDGSSCPTCNLGKEQKITHLYSEYIFSNYIKSGKKFIVEKSLIEIFPINYLPEILRHHNVHVDSYSELHIDNREIKLAVEYNGEQHEDSSNGWKAFQRISHFKGTYQEWRDLIERDKAKVKKFKKNNINDYYLIVVPHTVRPESRFNYIISDFEHQSGIKLEEKNYIDWRSLYYKKSLKS